MTYVLVTYERAHDAMEAAATLVDAGIRGTLIPRPRTLTAKCGVALRLSVEDAPSAIKVLRSEGLLGDLFVSEDGRKWEALALESFEGVKSDNAGA